MGPWIALFGLGAIHGLNPAMGWLFAVALGLQRGERRAVWAALLPLGVGHALAIVAATLVAAALGRVLPVEGVKWLVVASLAALGLRQFRGHRHPSAGGMRVNARELVVWSFLVATVHGAGLMAVPLTGALEPPSTAASHAAHAGVAAPVAWSSLAATIVHSAGYLLLTGALAVVVYEKAGLRLLRSAWINVDVLWAASLLITAAFIAMR